MKSTNVIDLAAWRAAHAPEVWRGLYQMQTPSGVSSLEDELLALLMSLEHKAKAAPGS